MTLKEIWNELIYWQHYYNWERPHGSLGGKSPNDKLGNLLKETPFWENDKLGNLLKETPFWDDVEKMYDPKKEHFQEKNYHIEMQLRKLKGSM